MGPLGIVERAEVVKIQQHHGQRLLLQRAFGQQLLVGHAQPPAIEHGRHLVGHLEAPGLVQFVRQFADTALQIVGTPAGLLEFGTGLGQVPPHGHGAPHDVPQHLRQVIDIGHALDALDKAVERLGIGSAGIHQLGQIADPLREQLFQFGQRGPAHGQQVAMLLQVVPHVLSHLLQLAPVDTFGLCPDGTANGRELLDDPGFFPGQDGYHVADGVQQRSQRDDETLAAFGQATGAGQFAVFIGFDDAVRKASTGTDHRNGGRLELLLDLFPGDGIVLGRGRQALLRQMQEGGLGQTDVSPAFAFSLQDQAPFAAPTCTMRHNDNAPCADGALVKRRQKTQPVFSSACH